MIMIDAHSGGASLCDRRSRLDARRIDDPDQAEVDELVLDRLVLGRPRTGGQRPVGDRERAQREVGEPVDGGQDFAPAGLRERAHFAGDPFGGATCEQHVGRALRHDVDVAGALRVGFQSAHQLAFGSERHLADPLETRLSSLG